MEKVHLSELRKGSMVVVNGHREEVYEIYRNGIRTASSKYIRQNRIEPSYITKDMLRSYGFTERICYGESIMNICLYSQDDESGGLFLEAFYTEEESNRWLVGVTTAPEDTFCCTEHEFQNLFLALMGFDVEYNEERILSGWVVYDLSDEKKQIHYVPLNDAKGHIKSVKCKCKPKLDMENGISCVGHNSYDGREAVELANSILNGYDT